MKRSPSRAAFSLVEVTMAMAVAVFCLLVLIALLPVGIAADKNMVQQTVATGLMASVVADLRNTYVPTEATDPTYGTAAIPSPRFGILIPRASATSPTLIYTFFLQDDGSLAGTLNTNATAASNARYRVQLDFYPPGSVPLLPTTGTPATAATTSLGPTRVRVLVTWPALADPSATTAPQNFAGSVETVVYLNRNWMDH